MRTQVSFLYRVVLLWAAREAADLRVYVSTILDLLTPHLSHKYSRNTYASGPPCSTTNMGGYQNTASRAQHNSSKQHKKKKHTHTISNNWLNHWTKWKSRQNCCYDEQMTSTSYNWIEVVIVMWRLCANVLRVLNCSFIILRPRLAVCCWR